MNKYRKLIDHFKGRRPLLNIILDGYGLGKKDFTDGIFLSHKPNLDKLFSSFPTRQLFTHGHYVGLPSDKDIGGSEVGHLTIGAGTIKKQGATVIKHSIDDGSFFKLPVLVEALEQAKKGSLHLVGLLSDGNVHSHIDHWIAIIEAADQRGVARCYLHILLDGRDTPIQSALSYIERIEALLHKINQKGGRDYRIVSGGGRETITMDRDNNWPKVALGYQTHVKGKSGNNFASAEEAVLAFRKAQPKIIDQDLPPFNVLGPDHKVVEVKDQDSMIFVNFRSDRAIEFTQAMVEKDFKGFERPNHPTVYYAGMTIYNEDTHTPEHVIITGAKVENPFGKRILELNLNQFRLAETQKFPHVTFFFNGGYRNPLDPAKEEYFLIPSDKIPSFALKPEMQAALISKKCVELLKTNKYDYGLINFANPDMVGHTGDIEAVKKAIAAVDQAILPILDQLKAMNGLAIVTADHGNADEMLIKNPKTQEFEPSTKHSLNPVPFVIYDPLFKTGDYSYNPANMGLANIAATNFILLGKEVPDDLEPPVFDL